MLTASLSSGDYWRAFAAIVVWCLLGVLVGEYAQRKGRSAWGFTALAIIIGPILGLVVALLVEDRRTPKDAQVVGVTSDLAQLGDLRERGLLTEQEFAEAKARAMGETAS